MCKLVVFMLLAYVVIFGHTYRTLVPKGTIRAGEEVDPNLNRGLYWSMDKLDLATDPKSVVGHKALKDIRAGSNIHLSDVQ